MSSQCGLKLRSDLRLDGIILFGPPWGRETPSSSGRHPPGVHLLVQRSPWRSSICLLLLCLGSSHGAEGTTEALLWGCGPLGHLALLCPVLSLDAIANLLSSNTSRQDVCPKPRETRSSSEDSLITLSSPRAALRLLSAVSADRALPRSQATDRHSQEGPGWLRPLGLRRAGEAGRWFSLHVVYQNVLLLGSISPVRTL